VRVESDQVSPNVAVGIAVLALLYAVGLVVAGYLLAGVLIGFMALEVAVGVLLKARLDAATHRRRLGTVRFIVAPVGLLGLGIWEVVEGGHDRGLGITTVVFFGLLATLAGTGAVIRRRDRKRARRWG
jgi:hypothetical protein